MSFRPIVKLIMLGLWLSAFSVGCADPATLVEDTSGCRQEVRGEAGVIRPETSRLSCAAIDEMLFGIPSEPQAYSILGESPRLLWKCRLYPASAQRVLLRCQHHKWHFTVVRARG
jgi:hypothetical protein